ncbi:hypothetical protein GGI15_001648 [Coemansia interrupta]|uniref:G-patch domain-containing protein n=1 Tax=Coemansia interrupta TaxID=1126814 RepID=A0A9W8HME5_9FUNG|nr:hypothetical protein GGI15_001648 [Coemansia interrupta]
MGLAEPKKRFVYGEDPRNRTWSDDKGRFGFKMLEKMGWSEGKGLGADESGVKEHVKIKLKTNNFGVGADKKNIRNWLANADGFSELLTRLNSESNTPSEAPAAVKEEVKAADATVTTKTEEVLSAATVTLNRLSHRAKFRNMKRMATQDAKGLQEIFGVRKNPLYEDTPTTVTEPASTTEQSGTSTPKSATIETGVNINDYFAKKMLDNPALAAIYGGTATTSKKRSASSDEEDVRDEDGDVVMAPPNKKVKKVKKEKDNEKKKDRKSKKDKKDRKSKKDKKDKVKKDRVKKEKSKDKKSKKDKKDRKSKAK